MHVDISLPTQFKLTLDIEGALINVQKVVQTDLGLPALGADWRSELSVFGSYDFQVTFVLDVVQGFYVETNTEQIGLTLDIDMLGEATGKLGFFEIKATASAPAPGQSAFHAEYTIDLTEPSGDDKLFLREIGTGPLIDTDTSGLTGEAALRFTIEAVVNEWLPSIQTGLRIDWEFDGIGFGGSNPPLVTYEGIQLNLGRLLEKVFLPFFETVQTVFDPFSDVITFLTDPLPVLKDFTDPPVSILGLAQEFARALPRDSDIRRSIESLAEFVETLATINRIVSAIHTDSASVLSLQLGDIAFGGTSSPQFDARQGTLDPAVLGQANARSDLRSQFDGPSGAPNLSAELNTSPGALRVPIVENPISAMGWILGIDEANLLTWDLPDVTVSFPVDFTFPVFPGILASIFGGLEIGTDLKVGLDTAGFSAYAKSKDLLDLFQGFYVSDRANADGTGADVNELYIRGELFAGAGVGFEILGVGVSLIVGGGVFAEVGLDLLDHDNDGKVRGRDLSSSQGCFALNGELGVALEARAKAGIFKYELPITEVTLFRGRTEIACPFYEPPPPTILAGLDATTGTLTLFIGPESHQRNVKPNVEEESFSVEQVGGQVIVSAFGKSQSFDAIQVRNIVADGGSKDDRITLGESVTKPSILRGGDGDDVIHGGSATDVIDGGRGRDELVGGGGDDILVGSFGNDLLLGDAGEDNLYGQEGDDILYGGEDNDTIETGDGKNKAYGEGGNDTILGGVLKDILYGGDGNDTIEGGDGPDVINGEAGIDTLRGQAGDDLIDGGVDGDFIYGDQGDDRLWGRGGVDEIYGGVGLDYLNGGEEGDLLYGQGDADEIDGDIGDDEIEGGTGGDLIYGGNGFDTIKGGSGIDVIYGGSGGDTIDGGNDNDEIYGEAGADTISGGAGDDEIDGGNDSDTIYGFEMDLLADSLPIGATDRDTLRGGRGFDRIAGGPDDDMIFGEEDADVLLGNEGADTIEGNDGIDTIYGFHFITFWSPVSGGTDGPNQLFGNSGDDEIHGGPDADFIRGQKGNDTIFGEQGADMIFGDANDDIIDGGSEIDNIDGGTGNDHIIGNGGSDSLYGNDGIDIVEGNDGDDKVNGNDQSDVLYGDSGMDTLRGGRGNDTVRGGADNDFLFGDDGNDLLLGNDGDDTIEGNDGNDVIYAGANVDTVTGGKGDDRIYGELGRDILHGNEGNDVVEGGAGDDVITGDTGDDALYGDNGNDDISGGDGNDFIAGGDGITNYLRGDSGNDTIVGSDEGTDDPNLKDTTFFGDRIEGGDGNDTIDGLGGADIIDGGLGNDYLYGGMHGDWLIGGPKVISAPDQDDDEIYGGNGNDQIEGGDGNDTGNGGNGINIVDGGAGTNSILAVGSDPSKTNSQSVESTVAVETGGNPSNLFVPSKPVWIRRDSSQFDSLADAIESASDGDIIEIGADLECDPITIRGKKLTLRGASQERPVLSSAHQTSNGGNSEAYFIRTESDLRLEGIAIQWTTSAQTPFFDDKKLNAVVGVAPGARLVIDQCKVVRSAGGVCLVAGGNLEMRRTCVEGGSIAIAWFGQHSQVELEDSVLESKMGIAIIYPLANVAVHSRSNLKLRNCTIRASDAIGAMLSRRPDEPVSIQMQDSIFDAGHAISLVSLAVTVRDLIESQPIPSLRSCIDWSEARCLYNDKCDFLITRKIKFVERAYPTSVSSLEQWLALRSSETDSIIEENVSRTAKMSRIPATGAEALMDSYQFQSTSGIPLPSWTDQVGPRENSMQYKRVNR